MIRMNTLGASAPPKALRTRFSFAPDRIVEAAREQRRLARAWKAGESR
jgi:transketolase